MHDCMTSMTIIRDKNFGNWHAKNTTQTAIRKMYVCVDYRMSTNLQDCPVFPNCTFSGWFCQS